MNRTRLAAIAGTALLAATLAACTSSVAPPANNGNAINNAAQSKDDTQLAYTVPLPYFPYSQIRQDLVEIEAINALGVNSTTFFFVQGIDHPVFSCPSVGVPVPATDQLSNPSIAQWNNSTYNTDGIAGVTVGQAEPEGVFTGDTSGTYSLCIGPSARQFEGYNEAFDVSVTASAFWDTKAEDGLPAGHIHIVGAVVLPTCTVQILNKAKHQAQENCTVPQSAIAH